MTASRFGVALAGIALALSALAAPAAAQWTRVEDLPPFDVFSLHANGDTLLAGGYDVVWRSVDDGASWQPSAVVNATLPSVEAIWLTPGRLWIGSYGQGVYVSPDFGATWQAASQGLAGGLFNTHLYVTDFERRGDSLFVSTDGAGTFVRALGGAAWQKFGTAFEANVAGNVSDLAVEGGRLLACAGGNGLVFHRDPGAPDWTFSSLGNGEPVPGLQASGALWSGTRWLVATQAGTYGSATGTGGWSPLGPSLGARLDGRLARREALVIGAFNSLAAATFVASVDEGATWQTLETVTTYVYDLHARDGRLFAARSDGLWVRDLGPLSVPPPGRGSLALALAGQHPVHETAAVSFVLPAAGRATLRVLDLEGREALRPLDATLAAGAHRASWSMAGVAPGVYFARLESGGRTASVRLARVR